MRRREFIAGLGGAAAWPVVAGAQSDRVAKVGILAYGNKPNSPVIEAFRSELGKLGYVEGGNLAIEFRGPTNDPSRIDNLASELVLASVDVIVTDGLPSALAAKKRRHPFRSSWQLSSTRWRRACQATRGRAAT